MTNQLKQYGTKSTNNTQDKTQNLSQWNLKLHAKFEQPGIIIKNIPEPILYWAYWHRVFLDEKMFHCLKAVTKIQRKESKYITYIHCHVDTKRLRKECKHSD